MKAPVAFRYEETKTFEKFLRQQPKRSRLQRLFMQWIILHFQVTKYQKNGYVAIDQKAPETKLTYEEQWTKIYPLGNHPYPIKNHFLKNDSFLFPFGGIC